MSDTPSTSPFGTDITLVGPEHVRVYRETGGEPGYMWNGVPTLLFTFTGRRSGEKRTLPIIFTPVDGSYAIIASKGGSPTHPLWYLLGLGESRGRSPGEGQVFKAIARTAQVTRTRSDLGRGGKGLAELRCLPIAHRPGNSRRGARPGQGIAPGRSARSPRQFFCWQAANESVRACSMNSATLPPPLRQTATPAPARLANSVRRTMSIDVSWPDGNVGERLFIGRCRDYRTPEAGGSGTVLDEAEFQARLNADKTITAIEATPAPAGIERLVGVRGGNHLRLFIKETMPELITEGAPIYLPLDDISGTSLVSAVAWAQWQDNWAEEFRQRVGTAELERMMAERVNVCWGLQEGNSGISPAERRATRPKPMPATCAIPPTPKAGTNCQKAKAPASAARAVSK